MHSHNVQQNDVHEEVEEIQAQSSDRGCCYYTRLLWAPLLVIFFLGISNSMTAGVYADLTDATFGNETAYQISGAFNGAKGFLRFCYTPVVASMSDSLGRRPVIITCLTLTAISFFVYTATGNFLAYTIVDTIFGLTMMMISAVMTSLISDVVKDDRARTIAMALVLSLYECSLALSFVGNQLEYRVNFAVSGIALVIGVVITVFFIPETIPKDKKKEQRIATDIAALVSSAKLGGAESDNDGDDGRHSEANSETNLMTDDHHNSQNQEPLVTVADSSNHFIETVIDPAIKVAEADNKDEAKSIFFNAKRSYAVFKKYRNLQLLCVIAAMNCFDQAIYSGPILLYLKDQLHFDSDDQSSFLIIASTCSIVFSLFVAFAAKLLKNNKRVLAAGLLGNLCLSLGFAFAKNKLEVQLITFLLLFCLFATPTVSSIAAQSVDKHEAGAALGVIGSARVVAQTIAPIIFGELFQVAKDSSMPGWPFLVGTALMFIGLGVMTLLRLDDDSDYNKPMLASRDNVNNASEANANNRKSLPIMSGIPLA